MENIEGEKRNKGLTSKGIEVNVNEEGKSHEGGSQPKADQPLAGATISGGEGGEPNVLAETLQGKFSTLDGSKKIAISRLTEKLLTGLSPEQITQIQQDENLRLGFWRQIVDNLNRSEEGKQLLAEISKKVGPEEITIKTKEYKPEDSKSGIDQEILGKDFIENPRNKELLNYPDMADINDWEKKLKPPSNAMEIYELARYFSEFMSFAKQEFKLTDDGDKRERIRRLYKNALDAFEKFREAYESKFKQAGNLTRANFEHMQNMATFCVLSEGGLPWLKELNKKYNNKFILSMNKFLLLGKYYV